MVMGRTSPRTARKRETSKSTCSGWVNNILAYVLGERGPRRRKDEGGTSEEYISLFISSKSHVFVQIRWLGVAEREKKTLERTDLRMPASRSHACGGGAQCAPLPFYSNNQSGINLFVDPGRQRCIT